MDAASLPFFYSRPGATLRVQRHQESHSTDWWDEYTPGAMWGQRAADMDLSATRSKSPYGDLAPVDMNYTTRMQIELDHLFVCTSVGAPEAERLVQFGLHEGPPNQHPGQGTACRRFSFANAMIELFWVSDAREAQSESTRRTLLWERWSGRQSDASPFGICVRPVRAQDAGSPFLAWEYRPAYFARSAFHADRRSGN